MRLLVTGSAGFVGSHVVDAAERRGWQVFGVDKEDEFPLEPVDVVISLAATADPQEALRDPRGAYLNGVNAMLDTLNCAAATGARVLHVSTNEVYGSQPPVYGPQGPYAGAKACQEIVCRAQFEVPVTIVVTQSLFGERQQPNKLVPSAVRSLLAGTPVTLQGNRDGWVERPFLYVGDLASELLALAEDEGSVRERVYLGAERTLSVLRVTQALAEGLDVGVKVERVPAGDRPGHERVVPLIGWQGRELPTCPLIALPRLARWYQNHPEWL